MNSSIEHPTTVRHSIRRAWRDGDSYDREEIVFITSFLTLVALVFGAFVPCMFVNSWATVWDDSPTQAALVQGFKAVTSAADASGSHTFPSLKTEQREISDRSTISSQQVLISSETPAQIQRDPKLRVNDIVISPKSNSKEIVLYSRASSGAVFKLDRPLDGSAVTTLALTKEHNFALGLFLILALGIGGGIWSIVGLIGLKPVIEVLRSGRKALASWQQHVPTALDGPPLPRQDYQVLVASKEEASDGSSVRFSAGWYRWSRDWHGEIGRWQSLGNRSYYNGSAAPVEAVTLSGEQLEPAQLSEAWFDFCRRVAAVNRAHWRETQAEEARRAEERRLQEEELRQRQLQSVRSRKELPATTPSPLASLRPAHEIISSLPEEE